MIKTFFSVFGLPLSLALFLLSVFPCSESFAADYDGDGKDDLEVVRVTRQKSNQNKGQTSWSVRHSSDGKTVGYKFSSPGAALIRVRASDKKYYPGIVLVKSLNSPLLWVVKTAKGQSRFEFGLPGDIIPNQADIDGDGIDDFTVVRPKEDGSLEWTTKLSKTGGDTKSTIFGSIGQRVMLGADGMLLTVSSSFEWNGKYFDDLAPRFTTTWGLPGDIPMAPRLPNQLAVTRPGTPSQLFTKFEDGSSQVVDLGGASTIPTMGKFGLDAIAYGWHDRSKRRVYLKNQVTRKVSSRVFGDSSSALVLPSGQVIQPGTNASFTPAPTPTPSPTPSGGGNNGGGPSVPPTNPGLSSVCPQLRPPTRGEIWKSIASTHIPNTDPRRFSTSFITRAGTTAPTPTCLAMYDGKGNLIHQLGRYSPTGSAYSYRSYGGSGCGDKQTPVSVAQTAINNTGESTGYLKVNESECVTIPNPNGCINSSAC